MVMAVERKEMACSTTNSMSKTASVLTLTAYWLNRTKSVGPTSDQKGQQRLLQTATFLSDANKSRSEILSQCKRRSLSSYSFSQSKHYKIQ